MFNEKDILARLQAGEDVQTIANEMTDAINAANATYLAEKKVEEEKKAAEEAAIAKAKEKKAHKTEGLTAIIQLLCEWLVENYSDEGEDPEAIKEAIAALNVEELVDSIDEFISCINTLNKFTKQIDPTEKKVIKKKTTIDTDKVFNDLFKMMGW